MRYFSRVSTLKSNLMKPIASERYSQNWLPSQDTRLVQTRWIRYFTKWPSWGSNRLPISTVPNLSTVKIFFEYKILHDFFTIQAPLQTNPGLTKSGTSVNQRFFFYTHRRRRSTPIQSAQHLPFERKKISHNVLRRFSLSSKSTYTWFYLWLRCLRVLWRRWSKGPQVWTDRPRPDVSDSQSYVQTSPSWWCQKCGGDTSVDRPNFGYDSRRPEALAEMALCGMWWARLNKHI